MVKFGVVQHTIGPLYYVKFGPNWQRDGYRSSCKLENLLKLQLSADIRWFSLHMGDLGVRSAEYLLVSHLIANVVMCVDICVW